MILFIYDHTFEGLLTASESNRQDKSSHHAASPNWDSMN